MNKVVLYIAVSLNGLIAREDGDVSWLDPFNSIDYGYEKFSTSVGAIVMGATTYEHVLNFPEWPYTGRTVYVLSSKSIPTSLPTGVIFYSGDLKTLIKQLSSESSKPIYLVGGGKIITAFLDVELLDEMIIFIMPLLLNGGIPLFQSLQADKKLNLTNTKTYSNGVIQLNYSVVREQ